MPHGMWGIRVSGAGCFRCAVALLPGRLRTIVEAEEQGRLCDRLRFSNQLSGLAVAERGELAREVDVFFKLSDGVAADDDGADGPGQGVIHCFAHGEGARGRCLDGHAFPGVLLLLDGRRRPTGEQAAAAGDLHADDAHLALDGQRQKLLVEAVVVRVGGVHGHQNGVEWIAMDAFHQRVGAIVAGEAEEAHNLLLFHLEQGFHGAALGEDLVDVGHGADVVKLPEVDVVGLEQLRATSRSCAWSRRACAPWFWWRERPRCGGAP